MSDFETPFTIPPGEVCDLAQFDTRIKKPALDKSRAREIIAANAQVMATLARRLYAENERAVLLVLQGMDASGKDGTIRSVMRGVNPRSCQVVSFKKPSQEELDHDYLWRVHKVVPRKGNIGIFNRSHYEDVLVVRVNRLVDSSVWQQRYRQINDFESMLVENGTRIIKCYLHISKDRQRTRLQARIDKPRAQWKFDPQDLVERKKWDRYREAYNDAITRCNTAYAPWHIVPSDRKWYRNLLVSQLLRSALEELNPSFPHSPLDFRGWEVD